MEELVSVIVPVYNAEQTIQRCIESILGQTYAEMEIILVDDGSKDSSLQMCRKMAEKDVRIQVITKENGGVSSARNCGIQNAKGTYILFLDSDDCIEKTMVGSYVRMMSEQNVDVVIGGLQVISDDTHSKKIKKVPQIGKMHGEIWNLLCTETDIFGYVIGKLFKRSIIEEKSIWFNEKMYAQEDMDFCLSYYEVIENFYLTEACGYQYYYEQGKRKPPYCDFTKNQLRLLEIAKKKTLINEAAFNKVCQRICGYLYVMFYESEDKATFWKSYEAMKQIVGLDTFFKQCKGKGEEKYIVSWYIKGKGKRIFYYFRLRRLVKWMLGKN